jgi:hypothetical protein
MTTTWTRRELIDAALENLGVLVQGQTISDEMVAKVDIVLDPAMAELRVLEIVDVTAPSILGTSSPPTNGAFPIEFVLSLSDYLAWMAAPSFNLAGDPSLKVLSDQAEDMLRRLVRPSRTRRMLRVDPALRGENRRTTRGNFTQGT